MSRSASGGTHDKTSPSPRDTTFGRSRLDFESEAGSIPVGGFVGTETAWVALAAGELAFLFCELVPRVSLLVFLLVLAAIDDKNRFTFK